MTQHSSELLFELGKALASGRKVVADTDGCVPELNEPFVGGVRPPARLVHEPLHQLLRRLQRPSGPIEISEPISLMHQLLQSVDQLLRRVNALFDRRHTVRQLRDLNLPP